MVQQADASCIRKAVQELMLVEKYEPVSVQDKAIARALSVLRASPAMASGLGDAEARPDISDLSV